MEALINIIFIVLSLSIAYLFGRHYEKKHYASIIEREKKLLTLPAIASKKLPADSQHSQMLVTGNVVISVDYFKRFLAGLHNLFGGNVTPYETLLDRARREATLRMKEEAQKLGAEMVFNIKFETASISKGAQKSIGSIEMLAYGTALIKQKNHIQSTNNVPVHQGVLVAEQNLSQ